MRPEMRTYLPPSLFLFLLGKKQVMIPMDQCFINPEVPEREERTDADQDNAHNATHCRIEGDIEYPEIREQDGELGHRQDDEDQPCREKTITLWDFPLQAE